MIKLASTMTISPARYRQGWQGQYLERARHGTVLTSNCFSGVPKVGDGVTHPNNNLPNGSEVSNDKV
jgi:hypothetical protein